MTKYEYQQQQSEARKKHVTNIEVLKSQLEEARGVLNTIDHLNSTYENEQDRRKIVNEIRRIEEMLKDETAAYKATFAADPDSVNEAMKQMRL